MGAPVARSAINSKISATLLARTRKSRVEQQNAPPAYSLIRRLLRGMEVQQDRGRAALVNLVWCLGSSDETTKWMRTRFDDYVRNLIRGELQQERRYEPTQHDLAEK
jgi:hypothetical protein